MKTILIAEDDAFIRNLLSEKLSQADFNIVTVDTGAQTLLALADNSADLLILDLALTDMSGLDVLTKMRTDNAVPSIPVIIFSNNDEPEVKERCRELGVQDFFVKIDTDLNALVTRINETISK